MVLLNQFIVDSLFKGDLLYVLDVIFFNITDMLLMVFSLLISSFFVCELYLELTQLIYRTHC